jgi:ribosome biogenesis GTPase
LTEGRIIKALAGYYYVAVSCTDGVYGKIYQCRGRGILRRGVQTPLVGDLVRVTPQDEEEAVVEEILPRVNAFIRPPVANVDLFLVTVAAADPAPSLELTDRFLVTAEAARADAAVLINKDDLAPAAAKRIARVYEGIYPVLVLSAAKGEGIEALRRLVRGRRCAFAGASGVGKTSLLALLTGASDLVHVTGGVSAKTRRGKHTTRHVEIHPLTDGTMLYDTPGFSSFEADRASDLTEETPDRFFPEFAPYLGTCRFDDCVHENEPECAVRLAVEDGKVQRSRYQSYIGLRAALQEAARNKY